MNISQSPGLNLESTMHVYIHCSYMEINNMYSFKLLQHVIGYLYLMVIAISYSWNILSFY